MWHELQAKGAHFPVFTLKTPDYSESNLMGPDRKCFTFNDGQRLIGKIIDEKFVNKVYVWTVEDVDGNIATLSSNQFHKITNPKNFSKRFIQFKTENHILD